MKIKFKKRFVKLFDKSPQKIQAAFYKTIEIFQKDPFNIALNNHWLAGKYKNFYSLNISGDWRAIYREYENSNLAVFYLIAKIGRAHV